MVRWLYVVVYNKPPCSEETHKWVRTMFETIDSDHSGTLEHEELVMCYVSTPLITQCFDSMPQMRAPQTPITSRPRESKLVKPESSNDIKDTCACVVN